ncbi:MAG: nucleotidyltransferase family protein [Candidatus Riflebacteria bacterium]|nr:nucleotidyltransferase family protein [Candidatus Riflebacteria bacterium]
MKVLELIRMKREEILRVASKHGVGNVRVFGSVAREEETEASDVDFLVEITGVTTPWFPGGLINDLQRVLGRRVEVVTERGLNPRLRPYVLREAQPI